MAVRSVGSRGAAASSGRKRHYPGKVEKAARAALAEIDTDHAAGELLNAVATRLAQDVDEATEVRDRVAATRTLLEVLDALDTAVVPPGRPGVVAGGGAEGGADGDVFEIGDRPPSLPPILGDAEAG